MRLDGNFIDDLRTEIAKGQERRSAFIKLKLTFVVSLLGVGAVNLDASLRMASLLYLVPLVAFVFDLYVIGEDFGIKRAGIFIKTSPAAPPEERLWETDVELKRDMFAYAAGTLSSFLICIAAGIGILKSNLDVAPFWSWLVLVVILIGIVTFYGPIRRSRLAHFESVLSKKDSERKKKIEEFNKNIHT